MRFYAFMSASHDGDHDQRSWLVNEAEALATARVAAIHTLACIFDNNPLPELILTHINITDDVTAIVDYTNQVVMIAHNVFEKKTYDQEPELGLEDQNLYYYLSFEDAPKMSDADCSYSAILEVRTIEGLAFNLSGSIKLMDANNILTKFAERTGWNTDTMLALACRYIDNQQSESAFHDFIAETAEQDYPTDAIEVGDVVDVPEPTENDLWNFGFAGHVIDFKEDGLAVVQDQEGNCWDVEISRLKFLEG